MSLLQPSVIVGLFLLLSPVLVFVSLSNLLPRPHTNRLASIPANTAHIDNVRPYDTVEKWAPNGSQAGLHRLNPARVAYFDGKIRAMFAPPFRLLDAGCGGGLVANALAAMAGYDIDAIDLSSAALRYAESIATERALTNVRFANGSVYKLPFANSSFDVVVMSDVLEHLLDIPDALSEAARVLRPGGAFFFDTIDRSLVSFVVAILGAERLVGLIQPGSHDWRLFIRPAELELALNDTGFHRFEYAAFEPSLRALLELSLFARGFISSTGMLGGWTIGDSPAFLMTSYIGFAVKEPILSKAAASCVQFDGSSTCDARQLDAD